MIGFKANFYSEQRPLDKLLVSYTESAYGQMSYLHQDSTSIDGYMAQKVSTGFFKTSAFEFSLSQGYLVILFQKESNFVSCNQAKRKSIRASIIKGDKSVALRQSVLLFLSSIM